MGSGVAWGAGASAALLTALLTALPTMEREPPTLGLAAGASDGAEEDGAGDASTRRGASLRSTLPQLPQNFAGSMTTAWQLLQATCLTDESGSFSPHWRQN